jgi:hypothetical protein
MDAFHIKRVPYEVSAFLSAFKAKCAFIYRDLFYPPADLYP